PLTTCTFCGEEFPTRSSMFRHLERASDTCPAPRQDSGQKVLLLVGYDSCSMIEAGLGRATAPPTQLLRGGVIGGEGAAAFVLKAMGVGVERGTEGTAVSGGDNSSRYCFSRPKGGFSQASSVASRTCPLLAQEAEVSATADTICLRAPTTIPLEGLRGWLDETNDALRRDENGKGAVQLLGRMAVPTTFHAEIHAKRRRYEYLLPAWLLDETADGPWPGPPRGQENIIPLLRRLRRMGLLPFGHCNGDHDGTRRRCPLWHNFSASALPHSPSSQRRLYRFFAMEVIQSSPGGDADAVDYVVLSVNADAFMSQQVRGMVALAVAGVRGLISADDIAACIFPAAEDIADLLPVPLAPAAPCSLAEVGYSTWQMRLGVGGGGVCMSPGAQQRGCLPLEGWSDEKTRSEGAKFRRRVLESAAKWWENHHGGVSWLRDVLQPGALQLGREVEASSRRTLASVGGKMVGGNEDECRGNGEGDVGGSRDGSSDSKRAGAAPLCSEELSSLSAAPAAFAKVLRLLREADALGDWPMSTVSRSLVILGERGGGRDVGGGSDAGRTEITEGCDSDGSTWIGAAEPATLGEESRRKEVESQQQQQKEEEHRGGGGSGSFTLGAFPPPCPPPRGNRLFPELARAAFELEAVLLSDRPPSTTIAVNRNAQFKPHVDSGSGAGQSRSLIVGLGDYTGGELVVEGEEVDIRYRPLEFNGWTQRHWTRPFAGERYSLVWFTPKGCEGITGDARFLCR
ncbi:unnamed protein product, partial [Hapterophycus canaliculatus]